MSQDRLPPPPPGCLWRPYRSNPKRRGGTIIVEDVGDMETHERRRRDPDGYRPAACPGCGHGKLHVHDYPERRVCLVKLVRYLCPVCLATWRMVPLFVARMLWRTWPEVEAETLGPAPPPAAPRVPQRTVRRWRARLAAAVAALGDAFGDCATATVARVTVKVGQAASRLALVLAFAEATGAPVGQRLARLAAGIHALVPGARLM